MSLNFGVVAGSFPITGDQFRQISPNQWIAPLGLAPEAFTVFLMSRSDPLPNGAGLGLYVCRCFDSSGDPDPNSWTLVGTVTNDRPSTIVRPPPSFLELNRGIPVFVGIMLQSLEELHNVAHSEMVAQQQQARAAQLRFAAERISEDFFNFVGSYSRTETRRCSEDSNEVRIEEVVVLPMNIVNRWKSYIDSKIQKDPLLWSS